MTDKVTADHIYLLPLTVDSIEKILKEQKIDAVLPTMGGQTALNLCKEADETGLWKKYGVKIIGVNIDAIDMTENTPCSRRCFQKKYARSLLPRTIGTAGVSLSQISSPREASRSR